MSRNYLTRRFRGWRIRKKENPDVQWLSMERRNYSAKKKSIEHHSDIFYGTQVFMHWRKSSEVFLALPPVLSLFPSQPHFYKVLHVLVKIHSRWSDVDLLEGFLHQRIFITANR